MDQKREIKYEIGRDAEVEFCNRVDYCVGTGRMDLALQEEYILQLALVQEKIGFQYIRGHGLFSRGMAIYHEAENADGSIREEYNFTYLDRVMDMYRSLRIRPFLELGFMPEKMASGEDTVFYWKGNITPPASYDKWRRLVQATLRHLFARYGENEVLLWPIEVWNEPNLPAFWKDADMEEYFHLYDVTSRAVKEVHPDLRVGGPAICGVDDERWLRKFLDFVMESGAPMDFVTRHHYTSYVPERAGHYGYIELHDPSYAFGELERSRRIVDEYERFHGMDIHITEFNTSYIPNAPVHDTCQNAAYVAHMLSRLGDCHASYSYWTFGDVFEEFGAPFTPFHGGFGLVANGEIPKPTFWTFVFYKKLQGKCVHRSEDAVIVRREDGSFYGIAWNPDNDGSGAEKELGFVFEVGDENEVIMQRNAWEDLKTSEDSEEKAGRTLEYCLILQTVDESHGNPLKIWHDMGEPANLSPEDIGLLREMARPWVQTETILLCDGKMEVQLQLAKNAVAGFELKPVERRQDNGYDYERATGVKVR